MPIAAPWATRLKPTPGSTRWTLWETDFYVNGFNTTERDAELKERYRDRFILNSAWDPRDEEAGLAAFEEKVERWGIKGVKLYTAEWRGDSRGWSLDDPWAERYLDKCVELGVKNIHVHKGPTIWPLNKDSFDVQRSTTPPRTSPTSTSSSSTSACPASRTSAGSPCRSQRLRRARGAHARHPPRPRYFADVMAELLFWLGEDRLLFASDYALWHPKWIVEKFVDFELPPKAASPRTCAPASGP